MTPVLFLHAFGAAGRSWDAVRAHLPEALRGQAPDLPGFGGAAPLAETDFDAYAGWIADTAHALGAPAVLVTHSMSGKLALRVAAEHPDRVASLVLVAPSTPGAEPMAPGDRAEQAAAFGDADAARTAVEGEAHSLAPGVVERLVEDRLAASRVAWDWWLVRGSLLDVGPDLARVRAPVAVVVGAQDARLGEAAQRRHLLPRLVASARLRVLPDCGHFIPAEQPRALADAIVEHVG